MGFELEHDDDYAQRRLERLELRYRRAQFVLEGLQSQHQSLRRLPGVSQQELSQSINRVHRAREQLEDILSTIEFLEDQHYSAVAVRSIDDATDARSS
jgi:septal ring factor EnvC (AmiA/AmiB activator)